MVTNSISLSYNQEATEKMLKNLLPTSDDRLKFVSTYGCGTMPLESYNEKTNWEELKKNLFDEYDDLWKELAKL
jgi:hypothetical protein